MNPRFAVILTLGIVFVAACVFFLPCVGPHFYGPTSEIYHIRFDRTLLALFTGGGLALSGLVFQAMFRNPLATPYTLGIASGASFGAALCLNCGTLLGLPAVTALLGVPLGTWGALAGAMLATLLVFLLAAARDSSSNQMLLAGVAVNFFFASLIVLFQCLANPYHTLQLLRWTMGNLSQAIPADNWRLGPVVLIALASLLFLARDLDIMVTGRERGQSLGLDVPRFRKRLLIGTSLLVGLIVSFAGPIGFVGLMTPHICRLFVGASHRALVPLVFLFGGAFLTLCDTAARCVNYPAEIPVGVVTSLLGGPFFLALLLRSDRRLG